MKELIESMTKIEITFNGNRYTVRAWREEKDYDTAIASSTYADIFNKITEYKTAMQDYEKASARRNLIAVKDLAIAILLIDRMNAVEILNDAGIGPVLYKDWP